MTTLPWRRQLRSGGSPCDDSRVSGYEKLLQLSTSVEEVFFFRGGRKVSPPIGFEQAAELSCDYMQS